ncbi:MAG TPA: PilC/PilY family type IV pilus protein [Steroidobacteraceae bacterium]|jgi:type IV pilus assembly protein PilY1
MKLRHCIAATMVALVWTGASEAQTTYSEDFTSGATQNSWYFFNGACLTAGTTTNAASPGQIPSCTSIKSSYYSQQQDNDPALVGGANGVAGNSQTLPDPNGSGALRFTNGAPYGHGENGAIVSANAFNAGQGIQITFKTVTYRGDSGGAGGDGADGMSFYLIDGGVPPANGIWNGIGSWGGSLGYTCSNSNPPYDGLVGAYLGLGIDEFGNFLNGVNLESGYTGATASGDNTALGYGYVPGRIGMRGAGNVSWAYLNANYPSFYPSSLNNSQRQSAVQATCKTGLIQNASTGTPTSTATAVADYAPILNAYSVLSGVTLANESAMARPTGQTSGGVTNGNVFLYNVQITQNGLLSFSYSINGGAYFNVISGQSITASNGALPATLRFGFAGSTGGDTNIHEILCFKAAPSAVSSSSAAVNERQTSEIQTSAQAYFSFYNPNDWTGRVTAYALTVDGSGNLTIGNWATWDSECVLSGVPSGSTCQFSGVSGQTAAESPTAGAGTGRQILTWNGSAGTPFEWSNLTSGQTTALGAQTRLNYLRGDRSLEINSAGVGTYRARDGVLADIVDSSPTFVGAPNSPYSQTWADRLNSSASMPEGSTYSAFQSANQGRLNVIYVGANDGLLHGFRAGSETANGTMVNNSSTPNDGSEVLAYMPSTVLSGIHSSTASLDYSNPQYSHVFYVDGTPGTGDLFYGPSGGAWHTWLVGGLGQGGAGIFALDITSPSNYRESSASSLVAGEWDASNIACTNVSNCNRNLGNTVGTPQIRRFHNGQWGIVFGNGYGSTSGDAGIYIMLIPKTTSIPVTPTIYYLSSGTSGSNGIAYVTPADFDGDHVVDYIYAGDLKGNVWKFDVTSATASNWGVAKVTNGSGASVTAPVFKTASGQPITTPIVVASSTLSGSTAAILVAFGTGQRTQFTTTSSTTYSSGTQSIYGVWDWNQTAWNAISSVTKYASLTGSQMGTATGLSSPYALGRGNLQVQSLTSSTSGGNTVMTASDTAFTWMQCNTSGSSTTCNTGKFGWYIDLPGTNGATSGSLSLTEQVVSTPQLFENALLVNSTIPANNQPLNCNSPTTDTGVTYALSIVSGGAFGANGTTPSSSTTTFNSAFINYRDTAVVGVQSNETGALSVVNTSAGTTFLIGQDISIPAAGTGAPGQAQQISLSDTSVNRLTWVELR